MEQHRGHPYHMYDAIRAQPEAFVGVLEKNAAGIDAFAARAASSERLFLVGIGTSYHAARASEFLFREYAGRLDVRAVHSFDFALYGPDLAPHDCVVAVLLLVGVTAVWGWTFVVVQDAISAFGVLPANRHNLREHHLGHFPSDCVFDCLFFGGE